MWTAEWQHDWLFPDCAEMLPRGHTMKQRQEVLCCADQASPTLYYTNTNIIIIKTLAISPS